MSTQWLPNMNRILSAARTYKRACGRVHRLARDLHAAREFRDSQPNVYANLHEQYKYAMEAKVAASDRLLWFIETGEKSLAKMKP